MWSSLDHSNHKRTIKIKVSRYINFLQVYSFFYYVYCKHDIPLINMYFYQTIITHLESASVKDRMPCTTYCLITSNSVPPIIFLNN